MTTTQELRKQEKLAYYIRKLAAHEQMKRQTFDEPDVDKALDRAIRKAKRKIKKLMRS